MSLAFFKTSADWTRLSEVIASEADEHREAALTTMSITADLSLAAREYERGWSDALRYVLSLPNLVLKDGDGHDDEKESEENAQEADAKEKVALRTVPTRPERRASSRF